MLARIRAALQAGRPLPPDVASWLLRRLEPQANRPGKPTPARIQFLATRDRYIQELAFFAPGDTPWADAGIVAAWLGNADSALMPPPAREILGMLLRHDPDPPTSQAQLYRILVGDRSR